MGIELETVNSLIETLIVGLQIQKESYLMVPRTPM